MPVKGSAAAIEELVRIYPREVVLEGLERLYREEILRVIREIDGPLINQEESDDADREKEDALTAWAVRVCDDALSLAELEVLLKRLLRRVQAAG